MNYYLCKGFYDFLVFECLRWIVAADQAYILRNILGYIILFIDLSHIILPYSGVEGLS